MLDHRDIEKTVEQFGLLNGTRGSDPSRKAVRLADMAPMLEFPAKPRSGKAAGSAPTKAEFDALVDDVHAVFRQMAALSEALRVRSAQ